MDLDQESRSLCLFTPYYIEHFSTRGTAENCYDNGGEG